jgi:hypothetical protein
MRRSSSLIAFAIIASIILTSQLLISVQAKNNAVGVRYITDINTNKKVALIGSGNYEFENITEKNSEQLIHQQRLNSTDNILDRDEVSGQVADMDKSILDIYNKLFIVINEKNNQTLTELSIKQKKEGNRDPGPDGGPVITGENQDSTIARRDNVDTTVAISQAIDQLDR